jgi:putative flippase GtrA
MISWVKKQIALHPKLWEVFKFLLIGGTATVIDFAVMWIFMEFVLENAVLGTAIGFTTGLVFNYIFSIIFVYTGSGNTSAKAKTKAGFILFAILSGIGLGIHVLGMYICHDVFGANEWLVKTIITIFVLAFNYITRKKFIFSESSGQKTLE